jgi:hypothetical protein
MNKVYRALILGSTFWLLIVAPMMAHLVWRPLAISLDGPLSGVAFPLSLTAVGIAALAAALMLWPPAGDGTARSRTAVWGSVFVAAASSGMLVGGVAGALALLGVGARAA